MPCNCDYMDANARERELSRVACLIDELDGKPIDRNHWNGYHPRVYNQEINGNTITAELCRRLQSQDVSKLSLEMQIWWRDHKKADAQRVEKELADKKTEENRQAAIAKLTPYERKLLKIE